MFCLQFCLNQTKWKSNPKISNKRYSISKAISASPDIHHHHHHNHHNHHQISPHYVQQQQSGSTSSASTLSTSNPAYYHHHHHFSPSSSSAQYPTDFQSFFTSPGLNVQPSQQQQHQFFYDPNYRYKQQQQSTQTTQSSYLTPYLTKFGAGGDSSKSSSKHSNHRNSTAFNWFINLYIYMIESYFCVWNFFFSTTNYIEWSSFRDRLRFTRFIERTTSFVFSFLFDPILFCLYLSIYLYSTIYIIIIIIINLIVVKSFVSFYFFLNLEYLIYYKYIFFNKHDLWVYFRLLSIIYYLKKVKKK